MNTCYLNNQFLIAMPNLVDDNFSHTVSFLCQHNAEGALAVIINRPTSMTLGDVFEQIGITCTLDQVNNTVVFFGGPVQQERGFIIHPSEGKTWDASIAISEHSSLTSSRDILEAIAENKGPKQYFIALGYAGWGAGQLEKEIVSNAWLNTPFDENTLYTTPVKQRWVAAANQIGVDINQLTALPGHA